VVALTFDGGANADGLNLILDTLRARGVPATFFLTGAFARAYPVQSRRIATSYLVGNHTASHPDLTTLTRSQIVDQIRSAAATITTITGQNPRPYFRFPFGARNATALSLVNDECYVAFRWTVDTLGWKGTSGGMTADRVRARVLNALAPGAIVLMHAGSNPDDRTTLDATALPGLIDGIRARGYAFVTLEAVISDR